MLNWIKENIKTIIIIGTLIIALVGGFILFQYKNMQLQEAVLLKMYSFVEEEAKKKEVEINSFYIETNNIKGTKSLVVKGVGTDYAKTSELVGIVDHQEAFDVEWLGQIDQTITPEGEFLFPFEVKFNCDQDKVNLFNKSKLKEIGVSKEE